MQETTSESFHQRIDEMNLKIDTLPLRQRGPLKSAIYAVQQQHAQVQEATSWLRSIETESALHSSMNQET
jgi:hypothetical protein